MFRYLRCMLPSPALPHSALQAAVQQALLVISRVVGELNADVRRRLVTSSPPAKVALFKRPEQVWLPARAFAFSMHLDPAKSKAVRVSVSTVSIAQAEQELNGTITTTLKGRLVACCPNAWGRLS